MSFESGWILDFCLSCDNQTSEGVYCSQACRLADLDKGQYAHPDPLHSRVPSRQSSVPAALPSSSSANAASYFILPPPFDFQFSRTHHRRLSSSQPQQSASLANGVQHRGWSFSVDTMNYRTASPPLKTASSRSSMSLDLNNPNTSPYSALLSEDARQQLEQYDNSFDTTRHRKHRSLS